MRTPVFLHPLFARSPDLSAIGSAVCMGSGSAEEVEKMLTGLRATLPQIRIHMVAQPECEHLDVDEWIDIRTVEQDPFARLRDLGRTRPELVVILMNGRSVFWRQWLFGALLRARYCLVYNEFGDGFFVRPASIRHLIQTLLRKDHGGRRSFPFQNLLETLTKIMGIPLLIFETMVIEASRKKVDPAFALSVPGQFDWQAPLGQSAFFHVGDHGDSNSEEEQRHLEPSELPEADHSGTEGTLAFTGERFVPGIDPSLELEHYSRYSFASRFVDGKRILDAGSGEGYGVASLAKMAREAIGIDVSAEAIDNARIRYAQPNLEFRLVDAAEDFPFPDKHFDVVTSFEVIEHICGWSDYLARIARVINDDGVLILSSPNRPYYRDERGEINEFHNLEFDLQELDRLLAIHFPHRRMFGQNHYAGILIDDYQTDRVQIGSRSSLTGRELQNAHYLLAVCSRSPLPEIEGLCFPSIRGNQMRDRERQIAFLQHELRRAKDAYELLAREFEERGRWALAAQKGMEKEIEKARSGQRRFFR